MLRDRVEKWTKEWLEEGFAKGLEAGRSLSDTDEEQLSAMVETYGKGPDSTYDDLEDLASLLDDRGKWAMEWKKEGFKRGLREALKTLVLWETVPPTSEKRRQRDDLSEGNET